MKSETFSFISLGILSTTLTALLGVVCAMCMSAVTRSWDMKVVSYDIENKRPTWTSMKTLLSKDDFFFFCLFYTPQLGAALSLLTALQIVIAVVGFVEAGAVSAINKQLHP